MPCLFLLSLYFIVVGDGFVDQPVKMCECTVQSIGHTCQIQCKLLSHLVMVLSSRPNQGGHVMNEISLKNIFKDLSVIV